MVQEGDEDANGISIVSSPREGMGPRPRTIKYVEQNVNAYALHNYEGQSNIRNQQVDGRPPYVVDVDVSSGASDGSTYRGGEIIGVEVTFSSPVRVQGSPALKLRFGTRGDSQVDRNIIALDGEDPGLRMAEYHGSTGVYNVHHSFRYEVQPEDLDRNGITIVRSGSTGLGEGTFWHETVDVPAVHNYPNQDNLSSHMVDGRPYVTDVSIISTPEDGTAYRTGEIIKARVMFNQPVLSRLTFSQGGVGFEFDGLDSPEGSKFRNTRYEQSTRGKISRELIFEYVVQEGDYDNNGLTILGSKFTGLGEGNIIVPPEQTRGEEIRANTFYEAQRDLPEHRVGDEVGDGPVAPTITSLAITNDPGNDGVYINRNYVRVAVTFNEAVTVTGTPGLELDFDGVAKNADYRRLEGNSAIFSYRVRAGDADGIAIPANSISHNGGSIANPDGTEADLSHDVLAADRGHRVTSHGGI